jgi:hypothetical protein
VVVVDDLDERLDTGAGQNAATSHGLGDSTRVAVDSNNDGVGEGTGLGGLLDGLDDDGLTSGILSLGEKDDLTLLQELDHSVILLIVNIIQYNKPSTGVRITLQQAKHWADSIISSFLIQSHANLTLLPYRSIH